MGDRHGERRAPRDLDPTSPDPLELDGSQDFDDEAPIADDESPRPHVPTAEERAVEAAAASAAAAGDIAVDASLTDREAAANDAAEVERRIERGDVLRWSLRGTAGLATVGVCIAAVLGAGALPDAVSARAEPPSTLVQPASPLQSRVCAGPALRVGSADGQDALALAAVAEGSTATGSLGGEITARELVIPGADALAGGAAIEQRGEASTLSAAEGLDVDVDAVRGFAASECAETSLDQWLVGGSTRIGRQSVLTIANASEVGASVDVAVYGPEGPVETVGSSGIAVAPGSQEVLDLAAIAPGVDGVVVHVASSGAPVTAHLQQTTTRGLERGGFDVVDPVLALPAATLPGVGLIEPTGIETREDYDDTVPVLRLLSPTGGDVRVRILAPDGTATESTGALEAGRVTDFPLEEIAVGSVAIQVEADAPVVAGARTVALADDGIDFDWVAGGQPRSGTAAIAVPDGPGATLHVVSGAAADQEVVIDGESISLPAGGTLERRVGPGAVEVTGDSIVLAVAYRSESEVGGFTASPQGPTAAGVLVLH